MSKFHIGKSGKPAACSANVRACPVGGDHYDSREEAQNAYEAEMASSVLAPSVSKKSSVTSLTDHREAKASAAGDTLAKIRDEVDFDEAVSNFPKHLLKSKADAKILDDVSAGKKVNDEKLDAWIEDNHFLTIDDGYNQPDQLADAKNVMAYVKAVRAQSPAPSTLPTIDTFDPSTQTLFSNPKARDNASIMGKAIRREYAHMEWMNELAEQDTRAAARATLDNEAKEAQQHRNAHGARAYDALKSGARVQAQLRELQYRFDTDESFKATANADVRRMLTQGFFRGAASTYAGIPIGTVRKVK